MDCYITGRKCIAAAHELEFHQYAKDTLLCMSVRPSADFTFDAIFGCVSDITRWFLENGILLNPDKSESYLFGTRVQRARVNTTASVEIAGVYVPSSDTVKLLDVELDSELSLDKHVNDVIRSCNCHTRALRHIRQLLSDEAAKMVAHGIVSDRLDYCNGLMYGMSARNLDRPQVAQNALARVVCQAPETSGATELR